MSKDELSEERIEAVKRDARRHMAQLHAIKGPAPIEETTLALIESRKQALELLERWRRDGFSPELADAVVEYLDQNQ